MDLVIIYILYTACQAICIHKYGGQCSKCDVLPVGDGGVLAKRGLNILVLLNRSVS